MWCNGMEEWENLQGKINRENQNKKCEFKWYVFTSDNRESPVVGFNDGEMALDFMRKLGDGAIRVSKVWLY